jgi:acyl dehydratase
VSKNLYFEDVNLGDPLPTLVRQPTTEMVQTFVKVWTPERGPSRFTDETVAKHDGFARPIVPGILSMSHLSQVVLAWADNIELRKLDVIYRGLIFHGERLTCKGLVADKVVEDGQPIVHVDLYMERDGGDRPLTGNATVLVPRRTKV